MFSLTSTDMPEPTAAELAAIDAEWPRIAAEIDVVDAEIAQINAADRGGPTPMDWRRLRRAEAQVTKVAAELADRHTATRRTETRVTEVADDLAVRRTRSAVRRAVAA
jgi:hypothetical protein